MGKKKSKKTSKATPPSWDSGDDDLEAALAASRAQLAELEVRAQLRSNAVAAEAAAAAAIEAAAMHAEEATVEMPASFEMPVSDAHAKAAVVVSPALASAPPSSSRPTADTGGDGAAERATSSPVDQSTEGNTANQSVSGSVSASSVQSVSSTVVSTPTSASSASSATTGAGDLSAGDLHVEHFGSTDGGPARSGTVDGVLAAIAQLAEQQRRETDELRRERQALADEHELQRKGDLAVAAALRAEDKAIMDLRLARMRREAADDSAFSGNEVSSGPASSGPAAEDLPASSTAGDGGRRNTMFQLASQRDGVVTTAAVTAQLPRGLTDPSFSDLPHFSGEDDMSYAEWEADITSKLIMVPESARGVYLRMSLTGRMKHAVDQDLAALGITASTVPEAGMSLDLTRRHAFRPSSTVEAFGKAVDLRQKTPGNFSAFYADFSRQMATAGVNFSTEVIDEESWNFLRIAALSHSVHPSVCRELLRHPGLFSGPFDVFRLACSRFSESLGHQSHGVNFVDGDGDGDGNWSAPVQGNSNPVSDDVFEHPWDHVAAWAARFPGQRSCGFCARSRKESNKASASTHLIPQCANMYLRNEKKAMSASEVARVTRELREVQYPLP